MRMYAAFASGAVYKVHFFDTATSMNRLIKSAHSENLRAVRFSAT